MTTTATLSDCLVDLGHAFGNARWCLIGGQAAILYGSTRMTQDVDVSLLLAPALWPAMLDQLQRAGFVSRIDAPLNFAERTRVLLMRHERSQIPIDIVLAGPGLEEVFLERARTISGVGVALRVIAPEDLIASKLLAGRDRDLADIAAVIRRCRELDISRVEETLALLEDALNRSDLLSMFQRMRAAPADDRY